jgi:acyl-CoA synthetase (AMP-forming)/AMP-acid ligase II
VPEDISLLQRILHHEQNRPEWVFCSFLDHQAQIRDSMTVAAFMTNVRSTAARLRRQGVRQGDRVVLSLPTSRAFVTGYFAVQWLGGIPVPTPEPNLRFKRHAYFERIVRVIADCSPAACIVLPEAVRDFDADASPAGWQALRDLLLPWENDDPTSVIHTETPPIESRPDDIAFLQYTSGSTGSPKGVAVTHRALNANMSGMQLAVELEAYDVMVSWMPIYHDMGLIGGLLLPMHVGMSTYLLSTMAFLNRPESWLKAVSEYRASISPGTNYAYNLCARKLRPERLPPLDLSCWKRAVTGAEPVDIQTIRAFQSKFEAFGLPKNATYPVFGMAEATLGISFPKPLAACRVDWISRRSLNENGVAVPATAGDSDATGVVCCGMALPGHRLEIRDPASGRRMAEREIGEICFHGPSVCPGYYHEIKAGRLHHARAELRTGDLGYLSGDSLYIVGRLKDVMQIGGANYYPADIESVLQDIPGVRSGRIVAVAIRKPSMGTDVLVIVVEPAGSADELEIRSQIQETVRQRIGLSVGKVVFLPKGRLPLTTSGKIMRAKCAELVLEKEDVDTAPTSARPRSARSCRMTP